jgi:hypothetical protein
MKRVTGSALLVLLMMSLSLSSAASLSPGMSAQILTATPARTVVAVEFAAATVAERLTAPIDGARPTDGFGSILAIAGHGTPVAHVLQYELGAAVQLSSALDDANIAVQPDELVAVGEPAIWHDLRVVNVGYRPVMRDANGDVRMVSSLQVEVTTSGGGVNEKNDPVSFSYAFRSAYREIVANLDDLYPTMEIRPPGRMLVIVSSVTYDQLLNPFPDPFLNWVDLKTRKGYQVQVATRNMIWQSVGDSSRNGIKQYIQQAYDNSGDQDLEYVLILGDSPSNQSQDGPVWVPTWWMPNPEDPTHEVKPGDNAYACVAGDDYLPDILIGRVSATPTQISAYLSKVFRYETDPFTSNPGWFQSMTCIAGNFTDTSPPPSVTPVWNVNWARGQMMQDGCITDADTFYYHDDQDPPPGYLWPFIRDDVNFGTGGTSLILYRGWAAQDRWWYPLVTKGEVHNEIQCGRKNPALFSIVCGTGDFAWSDPVSFGEEWVFNLGSVSASNGAIVFFGASDVHTNTRHNNAILAGMIDAMKASGERSTGPLAITGKMEAYRQFPLEHDSWIPYFVFHVFNILGDPETQLTICQPGTMDVAYPPSLTRGTEVVDFTVTSGGQPIENAVVTLRAGHAGTVVRTLTDASGHAWLATDLSLDTVAQVTVWKDMYFLREIDIPVNSSPYDPSITSINWQDGNDNLPNPGETVPFTLTVQNLGTDATDLMATVTSQDPRVTVVNGSGTFGIIQPGLSATSTQMSIHLGDGLMDGELPRLDVLLAGNSNVTRTIQVPVTAPWAQMLGLTVNDGNNNILEPGEQATISVTIQNTGHQNAGNLTAIVYSWDSAISFQDANLGWGAVSIGQTTTTSDLFQLTLAGGVTPGRQIFLRYDVFNNGMFLGSTGQWLTTGLVTIHSPTGPEAYGYYAYEDIDTDYPAQRPTYTWVELDPAYGGSGVPHVVIDDSYFVMNISPPFRYYGQDFDTLFVCSNGWFSFERPQNAEFQNWELPFRMAPWLMVCPFWDDLIGQFSGPPDPNFAWNVWSRFDSNPDRLTLMWRGYHRIGLHSTYNDAPEVFEAVLEYNGQNDGSILFQYQTVSPRYGNEQNGSPSNYHTVGIQDFYHRTGLTLSFANRYPPSVDSLRTGRAIRFTTTPPDNITGVNDPPSVTIPTQYALHEAYPNPFNPTTELRYDLPEAGRVSLIVYDVLGRERMTLVDEFRAAGSYQVTFDGNHLPSGLYFARFTAGSFSQVRKLMLVK